MGVWGETGALNNFLHPLASRFADPWLVVQDKGDGGGADSGDSCNIPYGKIGHKLLRY